MTRVSLAGAAVLLTLPTLAAFPQAHVLPEAAPAEKLGTVHFATSCSPRVAPQVDRAVALLHSFEFGASIRAFNDVLAADSTCAMAHWGIALSRWTNPMAAGNRSAAQLAQGKLAADAAMRLGDRATERERGWIRAVGRLYDDVEHQDQRTRIVAYERAMHELVLSQPADTEAMIFYAISLTASAPPTDKTYANQLKAGSILEALMAKQPNHPGLAHYLIHSYDYPPLANRARAAARAYASIAPSAAHAQHMPSHTFTRVGMWEESVTANQRSMQLALTSGSIAEALHASDYAMYADLQMGRDSAAKAILDGLPALGARFDVNAVTGAAPGSAGVFALAAIPARWALERSAWAEAAALEPTASAYPYTEAMTWFARALGASHTGDLATARTAIDSLASIQERLSAKGEGYWAEQVAIQHLAARAWLDLVERRETDALARMREAATREDATEKNAVTPGPLAPARELLGDMLTELKRLPEASAAYRATLQKEPNRRHSLRRAIPSLAPAAGGQTDSVDAFVRDFIQRHNIPAAAVSVVHHGKVMKAAGYGVANLELGVAATGHSVFEIGSITKQVSAVAVMMLVEGGKLGLDDPLSRYVTGLPEAWSAIRLRHLLTHTSGLHDWEGDTAFSYRREYTPAEFIAFVARYPLDFAPGSRFGYTNSAYPLLGMVVEKVSGVPYERFVTERIFKPAGMVETRFRHAAEVVPNRASGYVDQAGVMINGEPLRPAILAPNGRVLSTAADMARWNIALSTGTLIKPATLDVMTTPIRFNDGSSFNGGIAWFLGEFRGHRMLLHNGSTVAGFSSVIYRYPDDDLSVVVLLNIDRFNAVNILATNVASFYAPGLAMRSLAARPDPDPALSKRLLAMLADVADNRDSEMLAPNLRNPGGAVRTKPAFGFKAPSARITLLDAEDLGSKGVQRFGLTVRWVYRYKVEGGGRIVYYTIELTPDGKATRFIPEEA